MKFKSEFNTIVIVGNWNNAIFRPEWVTQYLLPKTKLEVDVTLDNVSSLRLSTDELRIFSHANKLSFTIRKHKDEVFRKIGELALKTADLLIHTPVNAFGINFVFECDATDKIDKYFTLSDRVNLIEKGYKIESIDIRRNLQCDDYNLNLTVSRNNDKYTFDFNYDNKIKSLADFNDQFESEKIIELKEVSLKLLSDLYQIEM